jgi:hypothetical protein
MEFEISEISNKLDIIEQKCQFEINDATDDELEKLKQEDGISCKSLERVSSKISQLLAGATLGNMDVIEAVKVKYEKLIRCYNIFYQKLECEFDKREINKQKLFNKSHLSIKLPKFKGYSTVIDIYSFKSDFEKLYMKSTPKTLMADILKNNNLEREALSLVKYENDIDEIWKRLKTTFGDVKFLLSNKLSELRSLDKLWKIKETSKLTVALGKIINVIQDLMSLAEKHSTEPHLYYGDGINQIYKLIGDKRTTQWLQTCSDEMPEGKDLWQKLLNFLEKELRIFQQKQIINLSDNQPDRSNRNNHEQNKVNRSNYLVNQHLRHSNH